MFSGKIREKKYIVNLSSADFAKRVVKVKPILWNVKAAKTQIMCAKSVLSRLCSHEKFADLEETIRAISESGPDCINTPVDLKSSLSTSYVVGFAADRPKRGVLLENTVLSRSGKKQTSLWHSFNYIRVNTARFITFLCKRTKKN